MLNLNKEIVGKVVLKYPHSLSEQTAIATILSDCDKEISSLEEKMNLKSGGFSIRERWRLDGVAATSVLISFSLI